MNSSLQLGVIESIWVFVPVKFEYKQKWNETNPNEAKQIKTKPNKLKQNYTKQIEIKRNIWNTFRFSLI